MTRFDPVTSAKDDPDRILAFLAERTGIVVPPHRRPAMLAVVREHARRCGDTDLGAFERRVRGEAALFDALAGDLTIGETYFFREASALRWLRDEGLPGLRAARGAGAPIRVWSAGCASGEETHSIAMVADELGIGAELDLLGTDIARDALARAREGVYGEWSLRGEGRLEACRRLEHAGSTWRVPDRIRRRARFQYLNLAVDPVPSFASGVFAMDVIFCRNVLVYFDRETITRVARKLFDALAEGGVLFLAATDPPIADVAPFEIVLRDQGTFLRRPASTTLAAPAIAAERPAPTRRPPSFPPAPSASIGDRIEAARAAFAAGDLARAAALAGEHLDDAALAALHLRAVAGLDPRRAAVLAGTLAARHPLATEIHHLRSILLFEEGRLDEAADAARRTLYLDRSLAAAHFTLAIILERSGDGGGARRSYRNALDLCRSRPADEPVPLGDGERAGRLAEVVAAELALLGGAP